MGSKLRGFLFACLSVICVCSLFAAVGCKKDDGKTKEKLYTVTFYLCTDLQTTTALPRKVKAGMRIDEPKIYVTGDNPDNYEIEGWYSEKNYSEDSKWDFSFDSVESDVTLYAKWGSHKQYKVRFYKEGDEEATYIATIEQGLTASECDDRFGGYAVLGYYTSPEFDKEFDFEAAINADTDVFVKLSDYIYLSPKYLAGFEAKNNASCKLAADGSTAEIIYETKDSFIYLKGLNLALNGRELIEIVYKLEGGDRADIYWFASDGEGKPVAGFSDFNEVTKSIGAKSFFTEITTDEEGWTHAVYDLTRPKGYADGQIGQLTDVAVINGIRLDISGGSFPAKFIVKSIQGQKKPELLGNPVEFYVDGELKSTIGVANGEKAQKPADEELVLGRQIVGYYTDEAFTNEFDFNTPITKATVLYAKTSDYMYFNGAMLDGFTAAAGATKTLNDDGTLSIKGNNGSFIHRKGLAIDINTGNCIEMKVKAVDFRVDLYIFGDYTKDGKAFSSTDYGQENTLYRGLTTQGWAVSEPDAEGYVIMKFDLAYTKNGESAQGVKYNVIKGFRIDIAEGSDKELIIEYVKSTGDGDVSEPEKYSVNYYVGEKSVYSEKISKGDLPGGVPEKEFSVLGRQIVGYYTDAALTNAFDIANTAITGDTKLYIKTSDYLYFNGAMISKFAGGNVTGKTLNDDGTVTLTGKSKFIHQKGLNLDLNGTNCIEIKAKADVLKARVDIYLFGTYISDGTAGESTDYGAKNYTWYKGVAGLGWTVSEPDEEGYVTMRYDLSYCVDTAGNVAAKDFSYSVIKGFRIDLTGCETLTVEYVKSVKA
jgi:lipoprotein